MKRFLVYFFGTDFDRVKIGRCSGNLYRRRVDIQTGCPDPIKLLGVILCRDRAEMRTLEGELHSRFEDYNTIGEWFRLVPEITAYIEEFAESGIDVMDEDHQRYHKDKYQRSKNSENDREYQREYYQRNKERTKERNSEYQREYYQRNREDRRKYQREYRQRPEVRDRERKRNRERYRNNPEVRERQRERDHNRYHNNPKGKKKKREDHRKWLEKNRENVNKRRRERYRNKD